MPDRSKARRRWLWKQGYRRCAYCNIHLKWKGEHQLTADHVVPRSAGGYDKRRNLAPACPSCNQRKGSMSADAFRALMAEEVDLGAFAAFA